MKSPLNPRQVLHLGRPLRTRHWLPNSGGLYILIPPRIGGLGGQKFYSCRRSKDVDLHVIATEKPPNSKRMKVEADTSTAHLS